MTTPVDQEPATTAVTGAPATAGTAWLRRHRVFLVLLVAGAALRVVVQLAYVPAILYIDSYGYLHNTAELNPLGPRPIGYNVLLLRRLLPLGDLALVPLVQHLLGLGTGGLLYALLLRLRVRPWLAALAAAPVLLDGYVLQIEHNVMSDAPFLALVVAALALLLWRRQPTYPHAAAAGLLLGAAATVRLVGQALLLVGVAGALAAVGSWRRRLGTAAVLAVFGLAPLAAYGLWFAGWDGSFGFTTWQGRVMYGRVAPIADCQRLAAATAPGYVLRLCPSEPLGQRLRVDDYVHFGSSPAKAVQLPPGVERDAALREFFWWVARTQPGDLARVVARDFLKGFAPVRTTAPEDVPLERWRFQLTYPVFFDPAEAVATYGGDGPFVRPRLAAFLRAYQTVGYVPGTLLGVALLLGLAAAGGLGRARRSPLRRACLVFCLAGGGLLLLAAAYEFSWRYQLPGVVLLPPAGALGVTALCWGWRGDLVAAARAAARPDAVDAAARAGFTARYGQARLAPVVVLIAAYDEAATIGAVLDELPERVAGLAADRLVVVDGATDATAQVARRHGAYVCEAERSRGQGAALRLGYRLAHDAGARFVATTDADGQYDPADLERLLRPLLADTADFVTGSRRLGRQETADPVRHLGVRVFAALVSALAGTRVSDTSFGLRAMKAQVPLAVTLAQPQYQSAELLLGVLAAGFRVAEVPATIRPRAAGHSKKGSNLAYGLRYARVVLTTWLRETAPAARRPLTEAAAAR